jgi:hypothetical protein
MILRKWCSLATFLFFVFSFINFRNENDPLPAWIQILHNALNLASLLCIIVSYKYINAMYLCIVVLQLRTFFGFLQRTDVLNAVDPKQESYVTILLFNGVIINANFLGYIFDRFKNTLNILTVVILIFGLNLRIYGFENLGEDLGNMLTNSMTFLLMLPFYMYCNTSFMNIIKK